MQASPGTLPMVCLSCKQMEDVRSTHAALLTRCISTTLTVTPGIHDERTWGARLPGVPRTVGPHGQALP